MNRPVLWSADALADFNSQIAYLASENPMVARRVADAIDKAALALGGIPTGRPGRVTGTYEKSVTCLPYSLAYAITQAGDEHAVAIIRVIHTARNWPAEKWPS